jgi:hypothetical protein
LEGSNFLIISRKMGKRRSGLAVLDRFNALAKAVLSIVNTTAQRLKELVGRFFVVLHCQIWM